MRSLALVLSLTFMTGALAQRQDAGGGGIPEVRATAPANTNDRTPRGMGNSSSGGSASSAPGYSTNQVMEQNDMYELLKSRKEFSTLIKAVDKAGLVDFLKGSAPSTVFAPNDAAFAKVPKDRLDKWLASRESAERLVKYHVVQGRIMTPQLAVVKSAKTILGPSLDVEGGKGAKKDEGLTVEGVRIVQPNISAANGAVHVVENVLDLPRDLNPLN